MSQTYSPPPPATSRTRRLLLAVWAAMTLGGLAFVFFLGTNAPWGDEWVFVPAVVNAEPTVPWLWEQHNEHRLPLSRVIYYGLFRLANDFRAAMYAQVLVLSALSLWLMRVAAQVRGHPEWYDAFFPVSLLNLGHWENFIMGYQLFFVLFTALAAAVAVVAVRTTRETAFRSGLTAGVLLWVVMTTGAFGLALIPPVGLWLLYLAAVVWRGGEAGWKSLVLVALAVLPVAYMAAYFAGYQRPGQHPPLTTEPLRLAHMTGIVLSLAVGVGVSGVWWAVAVAEVVLGLATVAMLLRRPAEERPAALGLVAVAAGVFGVALTIGAARAEWPSEQVQGWSRYSHLVWPLLGAAYLAWVKAGRKLVPVLLFALAAVALPTNTGTGIYLGHAARVQYREMEEDLRAGVSAGEIVRVRFAESPHSHVLEACVRGIVLLREAGVFPGSADGSR
jgi:hypothetical protein